MTRQASACSLSRPAIRCLVETATGKAYPAHVVWAHPIGPSARSNWERVAEPAREGGLDVSRALRTMTLVAAAILLAACGGNGNGAGDGGDGGGGAATLSMVDNAFQPTSLTVSAGAELQVTNDGQALHNLTIEGTDVNQDVEAGQSSTVSVDIDAGDYTM